MGAIEAYVIVNWGYWVRASQMGMGPIPLFMAPCRDLIGVGRGVAK